MRYSHSERDTATEILIQPRLRAPAENRTCPFTVTALYTVFTEPPVKDCPGFYIHPTDFDPKHDHSPPYIPMDLKVENARRAKLAHDHPSLENPPLVKVQGFAGSDSDEPESETGHAAPSGAGAAPVYGFASADDQSRATPSARGGSHQPPPPRAHSHYTDPPHQHQPPPPPAFGASSSAPYSTYTGTTTMMPQATLSTAATMTTTTPYPHDTVMRASSASASPAVPLAPPSQQQQQQQPAAASSYPNLNPTTTTTPMRTELQNFLLEITPAFSDYFPYFGHLIPLDTSIEDLLSLDEGLLATPEDHTVFNLFKEIKELPLLLVAMAADGVRKAKIRKAKNPGVAMGYNPRIAEGLEKARAEKWVRDRIRDGQAVLAREATAAAAV